MSILTHSPAIVRDGLILCLDAGLKRSTNALADTGHPTKADLTYGGPGVEEDYQPTGCKLISRADKTISQGNDLRAYDSNTQSNWAGPATGAGALFTKVSGSSSNGFYGYLNTGYGFTSNPVVGRRYRLLVRAKSSSSIHLRFYDGAGAYPYFSADVGTTLKTYTYDFTCQHATGAFIYGTGSFSDGETVYFDRYEVYELSPWLDVSGYNNHGDMVNAPTFSAESGAGGTRSFDFDGTSDYVVANNLDITGNFTQAAWVKIDTNSTFNSIISWGEHTTSKDRTMWIQSGTGKLSLYFYDTSVNMAIGTSDLDDGAWHFCVTTWDGTDGKVYVDGEFENSKALTALSYTYTNTSIGRNVSNNYLFDGKIAIVHMYNRALTAAEIQQNYRTHKGRFGL